MIKALPVKKIIVILIIISFIFIETTGGTGNHSSYQALPEEGIHNIPSPTSTNISVFFKESGLGVGLGRTWSVNINGTNYMSTNSTIIFHGYFGLNYSYYVNPISYSWMTNSTGKFDSNSTIHIHFYLKNQSSPLKVPRRILSYVPVAIYNNETVSTPVNLTDYVVINSSLYENYENKYLTNIEFFNSTGAIIPSWLQSGDTPQSHSTIYWLKLNNSIHGKSYRIVYMGFANPSVQLMNGIWTGESPLLSPTYGSLDDGYHVFSYYYNFSGKVINTSEWILNQSYNIQQDNGITGQFNSTGGYLASRVKVPPGYMVNEYLSGVGDGQDFGFLNSTEKPLHMGYNVSQGIYIRLAGLQTYPDMINYSRGELNSEGNVYGSFVNNENTVGTYTVETLNKSSSFDYLNYAIGNTTQPITGMNENYPLSFGLTGRGTAFGIQWISVSKTPPNYVMPYNFAANESENLSRSTITIVAEGISNNSVWGIYVNGQLFKSSSRSITLYLSNGKYSFYVEDNPSYSIFYNFNGISVFGSNKTYYVQFVPEAYSFVIDQTGLSGQNWYVDILNVNNYSIPSDNIFNISAASYKDENYSFTVGTDVSGEVPVLNNTPYISGENYQLTVKFQKPYNITFVEKGLNGTSRWYVNVTNIGSYSAPAGNNIIIPIINGTYYYNIATTYKIFHSPGGKIVVNGHSFTMFVNFTTFNYTANFFENNLSSGFWKVNITGIGTKENALGKNISFSLTNDTYTFNATSSNSSFLGQRGVLTINGSNRTINIRFRELYAINFFEKNLPPSSVWTVIINNTVKSGDYGNLSFRETNGSYSFHVYTANLNFSTNYTQHFNVSGKNKDIFITFQKAYNVTFQETGLGNGIWYVNISTGLCANASNGVKITLHLINEKYNFTVQVSNKTFKAQYIPYFTVNGSSQTINITFEIVKFNVVFSETGLTSGSWFVNLSNNMKSGTLTRPEKIVFSLENGSYSYSADTSYKKEIAEYNSSFVVNGSSLNISIVFYPLNFTLNYNIIYEIYHDSNVRGQIFPGSQMPWDIAIKNSAGVYIHEYETISTVLTVSLQNGTYSYSIAFPYNIFRVTNASGSFVIQGKNISIYSNANVTYYELIIHETGLQNTNWGAAVQITGTLFNYFPLNMNQSTSSNTIIYYLFNGTYSINFGLYGPNHQISYTFLKSVIYTMSGESGQIYYLNVTLTLPPGPQSIAPAGFISLVESENFILPLAMILLITVILVPVVRGRYPGEP